ncbi:hypothetical protein [Aureibacillus halotolerans]|uniref:Uncharacterized protein n=1 Tax=Aureibacillus halotolerans TaxID=1508390 RepID=A0A4R6TS26_9BACI|nr:hypothetical protein [Aureibacillus halotolerans]TDQ36408.1 hypothetical protein EV213_11838 [Aureibacillus halotolerans]
MGTRLTAFLIAIIAPGLGHLILGRRIRAFVFFFLFFSIGLVAAITFFYSINSYIVDGGLIAFIFILLAIVWVIHFIDLIVISVRSKNSDIDAQEYYSEYSIRKYVKQNGKYMLPGFTHLRIGMPMRAASVLLLFILSFFFFCHLFLSNYIELALLPILFAISLFFYAMIDAAEMDRRKSEEPISDGLLFAEPVAHSTASLMSLVFLPGLGHFVAGAKKKGIEWLGLYALLLLPYSSPVMGAAAFIVWVLAMLDLSRIAKEGVPEEKERRSGHPLVGPFIIVLAILALCDFLIKWMSQMANPFQFGGPYMVWRYVYSEPIFLIITLIFGFIAYRRMK